MSFTLQPITPEDIPRCVSIYFAAFQNAHSLGCWPRTQNIRSFWENMLIAELPDAHSNWLKAVSTDSGVLAGFAKWVEPKPGVEPDVGLPEWPADADKALCDETFGAWSKMHRELFGSRGHWYLEVIATDPEYQKRGIGSAFLRWGLEKADEQGIEAYLEASPDGVPLYEKFGFREVGRTNTFIDNERVKETWYSNLYMTRPPVGSAGGDSSIQ